MNIGSKIRQYRLAATMSQEELAERLFVSRQTLSNWENNKTTPDIRSMVYLSEVFGISLDELVSVDVSPAEDVPQTYIRQYRNQRCILRILLVAVIATLPLLMWLPDDSGAVFWLGLSVAATGCILRLEWLRRKYDIQTHCEIKAFLSGKRLNRLESAVERGKRPYQKVLRWICYAQLFAVFISVLMPPLLKILEK